MAFPEADHSKDLEKQKLDLDRDRLALEIRKFEADQPKRELELSKLGEELKEIRRPWYIRSQRCFLGRFPLSSLL